MTVAPVGSVKLADSAPASPRPASDWEPLPVPAGSRYTFESHLEKVAPLCKQLPRRVFVREETEQGRLAELLSK